MNSGETFTNATVQGNLIVEGLSTFAAFITTGLSMLGGSIVPAVTGTYDLGTSLLYYSNAFVTNLYVNYLKPSGVNTDIYSTANLDPVTTNTLSLGTSSKVWGNAYLQNLTLSNSISSYAGVASYYITAQSIPNSTATGLTTLSNNFSYGSIAPLTCTGGYFTTGIGPNNIYLVNFYVTFASSAATIVLGTISYFNGGGWAIVAQNSAPGAQAALTCSSVTQVTNGGGSLSFYVWQNSGSAVNCNGGIISIIRL